MILNFDTSGNLQPAQIINLDLDELAKKFVNNPLRKNLYNNYCGAYWHDWFSQTNPKHDRKKRTFRKGFIQIDF